MPVRAVSESAGVAPEWLAATKQARVNGIDLNVKIVSGTAFAPARELAKALGLEVEWDGAAKIVKLTKGCIC
ncbi:stalk domain-containing protein [Brevibacillus borstelensis]|uniref:stalk domain-containing protein n=1 Tax=Brevibacillus borstelensis TaxID=45462 RepID=UPI0030BCE645